MDTTETISVLCATDDNYAPYCGIMLTSLFKSNKNYRFLVYVFEDGSIKEEDVKKYQHLASKYGNEIVIKIIDEVITKDFPINKNTHITLPTYYRLLAADLLPEDVHKVIYLDCDVIVVGDIMPLWKVNLEGLAIAGAMDRTVHCDQLCDRLGYPVSYGYFNAGVLVYNLDFWREKGLAKKVFNFIYSNSSNLRWMDQDSLNGTLYNAKMVLPARYNFSTQFFGKDRWEKYSKERQQYYFEECGNIVIIHYQGGIKPWDFRHYTAPFYYAWEKLKRKSLWRKCSRIKPWPMHIMHRVKRIMYPGFFKRRSSQWVVSPENRYCYHECIF